MKTNVGIIDKSVRIILAILFVVLSLTGVVTGVLEIILLLLAVAFVITAYYRFCPLYLPFGINTWEKKKK